MLLYEEDNIMARINDIPVIEKVKKDDKISGSIWDKENGLYIPSSYYNLEEVNPILIKIPKEVCKQMVKDLMEEILKEQAGAVMD